MRSHECVKIFRKTEEDRVTHYGICHSPGGHPSKEPRNALKGNHRFIVMPFFFLRSSDAADQCFLVLCEYDTFCEKDTFGKNGVATTY